MKFWDSSAIVPILVSEETTQAVRKLYDDDPAMIVSWLTSVECASAIARSEREGALSQADVTTAFERLDALAGSWHEVEPSNEIRDIARRVLRVHALRSADALQLAAATLAAERRPGSLELVTLDDRLEQAAAKEGFVLIVPGRSTSAS